MGAGIVAPPAGGGFMGARWVTGRSFPPGIPPFYKESGPPRNSVIDFGIENVEMNRFSVGVWFVYFWK
jgi:hypothetical protein